MLVDTMNSRPATSTVEELKVDKDFRAAMSKLNAVGGVGAYDGTWLRSYPYPDGVDEKAQLKK